MNEPPQESTAPDSNRQLRLTPTKRILLGGALLAIIATACFSMWQTTLQSFSDDAPLLKESSLYSIRAAFTWDPVNRALHRQIANEKREVERIESWIIDPSLFHEFAAENQLADPNYAEEVLKVVARIQASYEGFVVRHPDHGPTRIAYGDFLEQVEDYDRATEQWSIALKLAPTLPAAWDRQGRVALGNNDFGATLASYSKAIQLEPDNWDYHYRIAALVFSNLDKSAAHFEEQPAESATRAISHYQQALTYNPSNFQLAGELAFAYAHLAPPNYEESMATWEHSTRYARDETDLEGVYLSMAKISIDTERFDAARKQIALSSLPTFRGQRSYLLKLIKRAETEIRQKSGG